MAHKSSFNIISWTIFTFKTNYSFFFNFSLTYFNKIQKQHSIQQQKDQQQKEQQQVNESQRQAVKTLIDTLPRLEGQQMEDEMEEEAGDGEVEGAEEDEGGELDASYQQEREGESQQEREGEGLGDIDNDDGMHYDDPLPSSPIKYV